MSATPKVLLVGDNVRRPSHGSMNALMLMSLLAVPVIQQPGSVVVVTPSGATKYDDERIAAAQRKRDRKAAAKSARAQGKQGGAS